ncbi:MAG: hypothetical protein L0323_10500 [Planctomycetes bacterium]|nr:hypothetical protein [Planctomycetota bacterium]
MNPMGRAFSEIRPERRRDGRSAPHVLALTLAEPDRRFHGAVVEAAVDMSSADYGFLYMPGPRGLVEVASCAPDGGKFPPLRVTLPATVWSPGFHDSSAPFPAPLSRVARRAALESWWVLPLEGERRLEGLLLLAWDACVEVEPNDFARAEALGDLLGLAFGRLRARGGRPAREPGR